MKSYDYEGYAMEGYCLCENCATDKDKEAGYPIFADSEWDYYPSCDLCGKIFDYINLTDEGRNYESR